MRRFTAAVCLGFVFVLTRAAIAQVPQVINYQGRLVSGTNLVSGSVALSLRLFDAATLGNQLYEDSNSVTVADGLYSTFIGDHPTNNLFLAALTNARVWIEVAVDGVALSPRERLASVGYSMATRGLLAMTNGSVVLNPVQFNSIDASSSMSVIGGGLINSIGSASGYAVIGGGSANTIGTNSFGSVVGGGQGNDIRDTARYSVIAGGLQNTIESNVIQGAIGGGTDNSIGFNSLRGVVSGGRGNAVNAENGVIPGGLDNTVGPAGTNALAAGHRAVANHRGTFVWADDTEADFVSTTNNQFIIRAGGGVGIGTNATTPGGLTVAGAVQAATLAGSGSGITNITSTSIDAATFSNTFWKTDGNAGTVTGTHFVGTTDNVPLELRARGARALRIEPKSSGAPNLIGGAEVNVAGAAADGATIGGGGATNYAGFTLINRVDADFGTIGGGAKNFIDDLALAGTIGGGGFNTVGMNAFYSTVAGGFSNSIGADATYSFIAGGEANTVGANASHAFAAGRNAAANHVGSFVLADSQAAQFASTSTNQFLIRANGGVGINANAPEGDLHVMRGSAGAVTAIANSIGVFENSGNAFVSILAPTNSTAGVAFGSSIDANDSGVYYNSGNTRDLRFRTGNNNARMTITSGGDVGIGTTSPTGLLHVAGNVYAASFLFTSDRNAKTDVQPADVSGILDKVSALPISTWTFKERADGSHLGPMAQDFHAAFGLGNTDSSIALVDATGVALAAIQALKAENDALKEQVDALKSRLDALEAR